MTIIAATIIIARTNTTPTIPPPPSASKERADAAKIAPKELNAVASTKKNKDNLLEN